MTQLGPLEVFQRFEDDLSRAAHEATDSNKRQEEAENAVEHAQLALQRTEAASSAAHGQFSSLQDTVIAAIESSVHDSDSREVLSATMMACGRSEVEVQRYFGHIDKLEHEPPQPIIIIAKPGREAALTGLAKVVYGQTINSPHRDITLNKTTSELAGTRRHLAIPVASQAGFKVLKPDRIDVFATKDNRSFDWVISNHDHHFDRVHFAASAEEVRDTIDRVTEAPKKTIADHSTIEGLGLPTMVAYGEDAVTELQANIKERNERFMVLNRRCLESLGIDLSEIAPEMSELSMSPALKETFHVELKRALVDFLFYDPHETAPEKLAFLGPLQEAVDYYPELVVEEIQRSVGTQARYSSQHGRVITQHYGAQSGNAVVKEVRGRVMELESLGIRSVADSDEVIRHFKTKSAALPIEEKALAKALSNTSWYELHEKHKLKKALVELADKKDKGIRPA